MGLWLKQSTAVDFLAGPFVDDTDGKTPETGLTITQAEVRLSKNGGNMAQKNEATALAHDELGMYTCKLDDTDTNTLGTLQVTIWENGALIVYHEFMVVPLNVWDSMFGADYLQTDLVQMGGVAQSATDLKDFADAGYDPATDKITGCKLTDLVTTVTTVTTTTTNTDLTAFAVDYTAARAGYLDELAAANLPTDVANVKAETALIVADTNMLQTDWVNGGRLDLLIDAIKAVTDTLTLVAIADAVLDEVVDANAPANANSLRETVNVIAAALAGKLSGGGGANRVFRDLGDTKDRLTVVVDANYNRTASTPDGT